MSSTEGITGVGEAAGAFSPAYAAFAINVDSRDAESRSSSIPQNQPPPAYRGTSILKHGKNRSANLAGYSASYRHLKNARSPPLSGSAGFKQSPLYQQQYRPGVRFDPNQQEWRERPSAGGHRRSSTAAFIEYLKQTMPLDPSQHHISYRITPKRAFLLFCVGAPVLNGAFEANP
jgi:hypothetical protein